MSQLVLAFLLAAAAAFPFQGGSGAPPPHHGKHKPPQEAIDACASHRADDACSFKLHDHDITGTCKTLPDDTSTLACRPDHPPPHHDGPPPGDGSDAPPPPPQNP